MADRNSEQYLRFKAQRTQPSIDLAARITAKDPREIIDIGCGPANSTKALKERFPNAHIIGADNSENMLESARKNVPECEFIKLTRAENLKSLKENLTWYFQTLVYNGYQTTSGLSRICFQC